MLRKHNLTKALFMMCFAFVLAFALNINAKAATQQGNNITMIYGETYTIETDKPVVSWTSSNTSYISVDSTGTLKTVLQASSPITVTAYYEDGTSEIFSVNVAKPIHSANTISVNQKSSVTLNIDNLYGAVSAEISDPNVATLNVSGNRIKITGYTDGTTQLTVHTALGDFTYDVKVNSGFTFYSYKTTVKRGEKIYLQMRSGFEKYEWSVSDSTIADLEIYSTTSHTQRYLVGKKPGTVEVYVKNEREQIATLTVEVTATPFLISEVDGAFDPWSFVDLSICANEAPTFTEIELPKEYSFEKCTWTIDDPSVVTLEPTDYKDNRAYVDALKPGDTKITITNEFGETVTANVHTYDLVRNLAFSKDTYTVYLGQTIKLPYTYKADNANHNNRITYGYDDSYGTIKNGVFTPKKVGEVAVRISAEDPNYESADICVVTILKPSFAQKSYTVYKNQTATLKLNGAGSVVNWSSSNPSVAKVNSKGVVTGVKKGTATITAVTNGQTIRVNVTVSGPQLSATSAKIYLKKTTTLKVLGGTGKATWKSSDKKIAKVDSKGKITAVKPGKATITATVDGEKITCKVTVLKPVLSVTKKTLIAQETLSLKITGGSGKIVWKSSNKKVAKVSSKGKVTAVGKGTATISAKINGYTLKCKVSVKANEKKYSVNKNVNDYRYGNPHVVLSKVYFSGGKLKADIYVVNNRMFKATKFSYLNYAIYDNNGKLIAKKKFKNMKLNVKPYAIKKFTLTFSGSALKNKKANLRNGVYDDWDYYYYYVY